MAYMKCPECGFLLAGIEDFYMSAKEGYYKKMVSEHSEYKNYATSKIELASGSSFPVNHILNACGIKKICCRMHIMSVDTTGNEIYS